MYQFILSNLLYIEAANNPALRKLNSCMGIVLFLLPGSKLRCLLYGLPERTLAYGNSRFCFFKFTKPAHEHHLQAFASPSANLLMYTETVIEL
jgi:hypothetical protein